MATRMMLRTSNNNVPLQLLRLIKDKTVVKSFPTVVDRSVFCGGTPWTMHRKDEEEVKDGFVREMRNGNLELLKGKSIGVEMRAQRMVSDEDEDYDDDDDDGGCDSEDLDDFVGGDEDTDFDGDGDGDGDGVDDDEEKDVKKSRK